MLPAESKEELQVKIDELGKFCSKWELVVGLPETKVMIFGGAYNTAKRNKFYFRGSIVEVVKLYTYLGVTFKHNLLFDKHIQTVKDSATKAEFGVISKLNDFKNYDINLALKLFDTLVSPIMEYGIEFWGHKYIEKIEKTNLHFYKFILGVKQTTTDRAVYGELGRRPILYRYKWKQIKFWNRLIQLPESRLVKKAFNLALELDDVSPFVKSLKITLNEIGKETNWSNQVQISKHELQTEVKQKVNLLYDDIWTTELAKSTKGNAGNSKLPTTKALKQC